jgi:2-hydroxychromene-2-carboxylate isomerase
VSSPVDLRVFFNFRSPYCYLAVHTMFTLWDDYDVNVLWRPLGGWDGRSPPDRAKVKMPLARQDIARWAKRMNIPCNPPPTTTDPTLAGLGSLLAEERGILRDYIPAVMKAEWTQSMDIGQLDNLASVVEPLGIDRDALAAAGENERFQQRLAANWEEAQSLGVIGVPSFVVNDQIFWGNDRIDFVEEYLDELGLKR